jgi:hypothetical protein
MSDIISLTWKLIQQMERSMDISKKNRIKEADRLRVRIKNLIWSKAGKIRGFNPKKTRKDRCGAIIKYDNYGDFTSKFGWEIDHVRPVSKRGKRNLMNLQPLHIKNNRSKSDKHPVWKCSKPKKKSMKN